MESEGEQFHLEMGEAAQPQRTPQPVRKPLTASDVRDQMLAIIDTLRGANVVPFTPGELSKHRAMFPIMAQWLDPEEGDQLVFQFQCELERLLAA